jgi:threonyl-tRNA synthetase
MTRVRAMSQDDAHIYCTAEQLPVEVARTLEMVGEVYRDLGLTGIELSVSTRPEKYIGEVTDWEGAEQMLIGAVETQGYPCGINPGEGAFYGPKIECHFRDAIGRSWQLATIQVDMAMPERFGLTYVGPDGKDHRPAMLHRAVLGSLERFIGVYMEHTAGNLPVWIAPVQVVVLPISERQEAYAKDVTAALVEAGIAAELDARSETLGSRIRLNEGQKIPYLLVLGDREATDGTVTVRKRHTTEQTTLSLADFTSAIGAEVKARKSV